MKREMRIFYCYKLIKRIKLNRKEEKQKKHALNIPSIKRVKIS